MNEWMERWQLASQEGGEAKTGGSSALETDAAVAAVIVFAA